MLHDLGEMIGRTLLVRVTYVYRNGTDEHTEFVGTVLATDPLVSVTRPGHKDAFTLPPDPKSFRTATPGAYTLASTGETVLKPRYETTWRVRAPDTSGTDPAARAFRPGKKQEKKKQEKETT